jgi:pyruvate dehydrogenase E1 component alpha subunit
VLEFDTYRYYGHSVADANAQKYRTKEEIERYKQEHDPIILWRNQLASEGVIDEAIVANLQSEIEEEVKASVEFAENSPAPEVGEIYDDVYWEVDQKTEAGKTGKHFFGN